MLDDLQAEAAAEAVEEPAPVMLDDLQAEAAETEGDEAAPETSEETT
jgi:hypothetical protein